MREEVNSMREMRTAMGDMANSVMKSKTEIDRTQAVIIEQHRQQLSSSAKREQETRDLCESVRKMVNGLTTKDAELAAVTANLAQQQDGLAQAVKEIMRQGEQHAAQNVKFEAALSELGVAMSRQGDIVSQNVRDLDARTSVARPWPRQRGTADEIRTHALSASALLMMNMMGESMSTAHPL